MLIHGYFDVDTEIVRDAAQRDDPGLKASIEELHEADPEVVRAIDIRGDEAIDAAAFKQLVRAAVAFNWAEWKT